MPGGPTSSIPRGIRAPKDRNFAGDLRKSTSSWSSCFASSTPATSAKVTVGLLAETNWALLLPKLSAWLLAPCARRNMKKSNSPKRRRGRKLRSRDPMLKLLLSVTLILTPPAPTTTPYDFSISVKSSVLPIKEVFTTSLSPLRPTSVSPCCSMVSICPCLALSNKAVRSTSSAP